MRYITPASGSFRASTLEEDCDDAVLGLGGRGAAALDDAPTIAVLGRPVEVDEVLNLLINAFLSNCLLLSSPPSKKLI
jgi:hypothetical protein